MIPDSNPGGRSEGMDVMEEYDIYIRGQRYAKEGQLTAEWMMGMH